MSAMGTFNELQSFTSWIQMLSESFSSFFKDLSEQLQQMLCDKDFPKRTRMTSLNRWKSYNDLKCELICMESIRKKEIIDIS